MEANIRHLIDFKKVDLLLEGFNKSTGFVTAILDLEGNVLSKSGWRQICTEFHRVNPETSKKCTISDTELANKIGEGEKYHFYKCLNGLVDVAVPIIINGEHLANLFSGQFFFEEPDSTFFKKQAEKYGFDEGKYLAALKNVPVVSREKVKTAMDFLLNMTQMISETSFQKLEQIEHTKNLRESVEKAKESASKLKAALDSMSDAVFISDKDGNFLDFNDAFATFHKFKNKQECAKTFKEYPLFLDVYFPNGALAPIEQWVVPSALRGEMGINKEFTLLRRDTNETWIGSYNYAPIRNIEGHIIGSVVACRDITDSKKAQFELIAAKEKAEESEKRFDLAMKASNNGLFDWNLETKEIYYSPSWKKMLGYEDNELPNDFTVWENTTEPEDVKKSWELQQKLITKQIDRFVMEFKMKHKDGQWVDILSRAQAIFNDSGKAVRIVGTHTNITDRKRSEILLHEQTEEIAAQNEELNATNLQLIASISKAEESEKRFRKSIEFSPLPIAVANNNGDLLFANKQFIEAFGYSLEELGSIPKLFELAYPDIEYRNSRLTLWSGDVEFAIRNSVPTPVRESFITCKNGSVKTVEISVSIEKEISIGLFQDITERKQAEHALMAKMDDLERFHKLTVGRELTMIELKKEVNNLLNKLGQDNKYKIVE